MVCTATIKASFMRVPTFYLIFMNNKMIFEFLFAFTFSLIFCSRPSAPSFETHWQINAPVVLKLTCAGIWGCCTPWRIPMLTCWVGPAGNTFTPAILFCSWVANGTAKKKEVGWEWVRGQLSREREKLDANY